MKMVRQEEREYKALAAKGKEMRQQRKQGVDGWNEGKGGMAESVVGRR